MKFVIWFFRFIYELLADLIIAIVGHHRTKKSFEKREEVFKPYREFMKRYLGIKIKPKTYEKQLSKGNKSLTHKITTLVVLILAILLVRFSVIEPYKIPSGSMIPTLKIGDHIFVNKLAYGLRIPFIGEVKTWGDPKRGEVVIFTPPTATSKVYVKRLIGMPGDRVRIEDDKLYINDQLIPRDKVSFYPTMEYVDVEGEYTPDKYDLFIENLYGTNHHVVQLRERWQLFHRFNIEVVVPRETYFMIGDNRDNSEDSRIWGFVPRDHVRGRAMFVWLSLNWAKPFSPSWVRFSRFGTRIK